MFHYYYNYVSIKHFYMAPKVSCRYTLHIFHVYISLIMLNRDIYSSCLYYIVPRYCTASSPHSRLLSSLPPIPLQMLAHCPCARPLRIPKGIMFVTAWWDYRSCLPLRREASIWPLRSWQSNYFYRTFHLCSFKHAIRRQSSYRHIVRSCLYNDRFSSLNSERVSSIVLV